MYAKSLQSCPTLCDPMDCSPPGFSVHGILEWAARLSSRGSSQPRDWTLIFYVSCIGRQVFYTSTIWETQGHNVPHDKYNEHWNILHTKVKRINHALLVGMQNGSATMKNGLMLPQKVKYRITIWFSNSIPRYIPRGIENRTQTDNCTLCSQQYYLQ